MHRESTVLAHIYIYKRENACVSARPQLDITPAAVFVNLLYCCNYTRDTQIVLE